MASDITIRGARTHNLAALDLDLPRDRLVVVVGVSGSGKSSLVFDTIAAEAGYQLNETYPPFVRNRLPKWSRPEVDQIEGLSPVIVIDQKRIGGNARSTVGTITDAWTYLRLVFSRLSTPYVGESNHFSFNDSRGMCPKCSGLGEVLQTEVDRLLDLDRSLADGAVRLPGYSSDQYWYRQYADIGRFDARKPLREWTADERHVLLHGDDGRLGRTLPKNYEGVVERFERIYLRTSDNLSERKQAVIRDFTRSQVCPGCDGDRLGEDARTATVAGRTLVELARWEIAEVADFVATLEDPRVAPALAALSERLESLVTIGLGYLSLARGTTTLSGGESQRIKMVRHLGSSLTSMTYVVDEPTVGLHPTDVASVIRLLERIRDRGNSVLVVEHDPAVMAAADQVVEIGPGAGTEGGSLVYQGAYAQLLDADTPTGRALTTDAPARLEAPRTPPLGTSSRDRGSALTIAGAHANNLRDVTVDIPRGCLTVLTGVAGSGKSTLARELVTQHGAVVVDQRPVSANRRSTPATYTGVAPAIRRLFASSHGVSIKLFSAGGGGGCPDCKGLGVIYTDLAFMDGQETECETCDGRRFRPEALAYTLDGLTIADVDELPVEEAIERLRERTVADLLQPLADVGLGYLRLGQALSTLSGGESQRVKIARHLAGSEPDAPAVHVLDEPTTGLHPHDIGALLATLDRLVDHGSTLVVIEHNLDVVRHADWLIDLGPGPGRHGGRVLYEGPVAAYDGDTPTARALLRG